MFNHSKLNKMNDPLRGYCVPYKAEDYPDDVNQFLLALHESHGIKHDTILCHHKNKYDMKTGTDKGEFPGISEYVKKYRPSGSKLTLQEGKGSPNGKCRGSNGFKVEKDKCNEMNTPGSILRGQLLNLLPPYKRSKLISVSTNQVENTRRPLYVKDDKLQLDSNDISNVSDMRVHFHDDHLPSVGCLFISKEYISQKSTRLVTFINCGVSNSDCFPKEDIQKGSISGEIGKCILKTLGLNEHAFCSIFNLYNQKSFSELSLIGKTHNQVIDFTSNPGKSNKLKGIIWSFLDLCLGKGDIIISHVINKTDRLYRSKKIKKKPLKYESYYGGKGGKAKRIDIKITTESLLFNFNIRNKQGGIYPSHIMCDFQYRNDQMLL